MFEMVNNTFLILSQNKLWLGNSAKVTLGKTFMECCGKSELSKDF